MWAATCGTDQDQMGRLWDATQNPELTNDSTASREFTHGTALDGGDTGNDAEETAAAAVLATSAPATRRRAWWRLALAGVGVVLAVLAGWAFTPGPLGRQSALSPELPEQQAQPSSTCSGPWLQVPPDSAADFDVTVIPGCPPRRAPNAGSWFSSITSAMTSTSCSS